MNLDDLKDYYRARPKPSEERLLLNAIHKRSRWVEFLNTILKDGSATPALKEAFHLKWIESGHFIREKVNNDEILTKLLVTLLPKYEGEAVTIYRGKNEDRFNSGSIGFCWTQDREVAEMFGSGLNACKSRGMLLQAHAPIKAIIAGPNAHSRYLGEHELTVDPKMLEDITIIKFYSPSH